MALRRRRSSSPLAKNRVQSSNKDPYGRNKGVDKVNPAARTPRKRPTATPTPKRPTSNRPTATPTPKRPKSISSRKDSPAERRMIEAAMRNAQARRSAQAKSKRTPTRRQRLLMKKSAAQRRINDNNISARRKSGKVSAPSQRGAVKRLTRRQRLLMRRSAALRRMADRRTNRRPPSLGIPRRPSIAPPYMGPKRPNRGPIRKRPTRGPIRKMPIGPRRRSRFGRRR